MSLLKFYDSLNFRITRILFFGIFSLLLIPSFGYSQTLILNEVSQGETGGMEYVEFVVVDTAVTYNCVDTEPPCIDIRGWIIDDNSGYHGGSGIAGGACRFSNDPFWSCIPVGTIILIYNDGDPNNQLPGDDITLADGNCSLVVPISSNLFETNSTTPGAVACSYPATGWNPGGVWTNIVMANGGDCFRIVDLSGCEVFSLCWDDNNQNNMVYFPGGATSGNSATNTVYYFNDGDPTNSSNWTIGCADQPNCGQQDQTPGAPNNAANSDYIAQFNNGCAPITPIEVLANVDQNASCICDGQASATASGSIPGYTFEWYDDLFNPISQSTATATGLCAGTYYVIGTSSIDCSDTAMINITSSGGGISGISSPANGSIDCIGELPPAYTLFSEFLNEGGTLTGSTNNVDTTSFGIVSQISDGNSCPEIITRTYEITDSCGVVFSTTQSFTVDDNIDPTATAPADASYDCIGDVPVANAGDITDEADNCTATPAVVYNGETTAGTCPMTITRTWDITDDCNNTITVTQLITVDDNIDPTATAPADASYDCIGDVPVANAGDITDAADNCTAAPTVVYNGETTAGTCPMTITRTWDISDDCGNTITVTQLITVDDNIDPTATAPADASYDCIGDVPVANAGDITDAADNCTAAPTVVYNGETTAGTCPQTITRTWDISDACGNTITVTQLITVDDNIDPTATAPADASYNCIGDVPVANAGDITDAADNCTAAPTVVYNGETTAGTCPMTITRTWNISDDCGNTITVTQLITVDDNIAPVATAPAAVTVECAGDVPAPNTADVTGVSDNCTAVPTVTHLGDVSDGNTCPEVITRTYEITDDCGNTTTVTQTITVDDTQDPTASNPAPISATGSAPAPDVTVVDDEADNCTVNPVVAFVGDVTDGLNCPETITRTYSVTDECGNQILVEQTITIGDAIIPTASNPAPIAVQCIGDVPAPDETVVDDEADNGAVPTVTWEDDTSDGNTCPEIITRRYRVTDDCGNFIFVEQTITVDDDIDPTATAPAPIAVQCAGDVPAANIADITDAADNCTAPTVTHVGDVSDGNTCPEVITRTYRIEDACGNFIEVDQIITINDDIAPAATAPVAVAVQCIGDVPVPNTADVTGVSDNCTALPTVTHVGDASDGNTCPEVITRTYEIEDACGNITTVTQTITVNDDIDPTGTAPADLTVQCIGDVPAVNIADVTGVSDNCVAPTVTHVGDVNSGGACPIDITRTYRIEDACGNFIEVDQVITVDDNIAPTGTAPADLTVQCIGDVPAADPTLINDEADNCSVPTVTHVGDVSDGNTCPEVITRTYRIEDACGNFIEVDQTITINDDIDPTGTAPAPVAVQCIGDVPAANIADITDAADNCAAPTVTHVGDVSDGNTCPEVITRTYRIEDACGNFIEVDQIITVNDDIDPTASNPAAVVVECDTDVPVPDVTVVTDAADNCSVPTVTHVGDVSDGNVCNGEVITRTYRVEDECGNFIEVTQTITIDSYTPTFALAGTDPTVCGVSDGFINISGLNPNTDYSFNYNGGPTLVITTDGAGQYVITGLGAGSYTGFTVGDVDCPSCSTVEPITITLADPNPPAVDAGANQQVCVGSQVILTADNPDGSNITWDNGVTDGTAFTPTVGTTTYTVTADLAGCINSDVVQVIVAPTIDALTCPGQLTAVCDITEQPAYSDFYEFIADGGSATIPAGGQIDTASFVMLSEVSDGNSCPETVTRTYQIADTCGVAVTCSQTIVINDLINPSGTAPAAISIQCIGHVPAADPTLITDAADNCSVPSVTHVGDVSDGNTCPEVITRTYRIEDVCGNFIEVDQLITINDDINPTGTAPTPIAVQCIGDVPIEDLTLITDEADNCTVAPTVTFIGDVSDGNTCPEVITRTYRIADDCGNFIEVDQIITVSDDIAPTASNPATTTVGCVSDLPAVDLSVVIDEADNCTAAPIVTFISETSDNNVCNGEELTRIYEIADDCGNAITVTHTIIIDSDTPIFAVAGTDPTTCGGMDGFITIFGLDPNSNYLIEYNGNAQEIITSDGAGEYEISGLGSGSYSGFTVSDADCPSCSTTDPVTITLVDPNAPDVNAGPEQEVCEGTNVTLTADNPDGANITWDNGITNGTAFTPSVGTVTYTVTADLGGCINTDEVQIIVNPIPNVNAGVDITVCEGDQVVLSGSGASSYSWDNGITDGVSFSPSDTTTYTVTGVSAEGCTNTDEVDVVVASSTNIAFEADLTQGCVPLTVNFTNLTTGNSNECIYTFSDGTQLTGCNPTHTFTSPGCHDVTLQVTNENGCVSTTTLMDYICVDAYPIADFTINPEQLTNLNNTAQFTNNSFGASSYEWQFGDGGSSSNTNPEHTYPSDEDEDFEVQLIAFNDYGCPDTVTMILPLREELIFYVPNTFTPDDDNRNPIFMPVFTSGFDPQDYTLLIFNRWGEVIFESRNADIGWDGTYGASSNQIVKDGTYVWKIEFKTKYSDERIVEVGHVNLLR